MVKRNLIGSYLRGWMGMPTTTRKDGMNANFPAIIYCFNNCLKNADFQKKKKKELCCESANIAAENRELTGACLSSVPYDSDWSWCGKHFVLGVVVYHQFITQREEGPSLSAVWTFLHTNRFVERNLSLGHRSHDTCCRSGLHKSGRQLFRRHKQALVEPTELNCTQD